MTAAYRPCPTKRKRRTKAEMEEIRTVIREILEEHHPMNARGVFYQLTTRTSRITGGPLIRKTQAECNSTVGRLLVQMRRQGTIPFTWITDATRWMRKPSTHSNIEAALEETVACYRRSVWDNVDVYVEVWIEKAGLAGTLYEVTSEWDVPLMPAGGYASHSFLYSAAQSIEQEEKPTYIYYLGDHDPSGRDIDRHIEKCLREYAPDSEIHFKRIAVTPAQIKRWKLPTRPTKKSDSRAKTFKGRSVELDAIRADRSRSLVRSCIEQHIDDHHLAQLQKIESQERQLAESVIAQINGHVAVPSPRRKVRKKRSSGKRTLKKAKRVRR